MCAASCLEGASTTFEHQAVFYRSTDELVDSVVPFVRAGLGCGEPVLVALPPERLAAVEEALGTDASRVELVDMHRLGGNPARIIGEWRRFVDEHPDAGQVRAVGEPGWAGRREVELSEVALHEALMNLAWDGEAGWRLMCPYDASALPAHVLEEALRSHTLTHGAPSDHVGYAGHQYARDRFAAPLTAPPLLADLLSFGGDDLAGLRSSVATMARHAGIVGDALDDLVLAAHEVATNSIVHGGGAGQLRVWAEPGAFVVQVSDGGVIEDPLVGRDRLRDLDEGGRGLWLANQLCDLVQVRSSADGTVVRLFAWL